MSTFTAVFLLALAPLVDLFLSEGPIVQTRGRSEDSRRIYEAKKETTLLPTEPLVVLVDGGSASAAEVVAGADAIVDGAMDVGVVDDPATRRYGPLGWNPADGNLVLVGSLGSGTSSTLCTVLGRLVAHVYSDERQA